MQKAPMISIVDDDESMREATGGLVRSLGYNAATYSSAEEFLNSRNMADTSCVITDLHMRGLSGIDLQARLKSGGHRVPVIFITAYPDAKSRTRALEAGAIGYLSKPFTDESLIGCLDAALGSPRTEASGN